MYFSFMDGPKISTQIIQFRHTDVKELNSFGFIEVSRIQYSHLSEFSIKLLVMLADYPEFLEKITSTNSHTEPLVSHNQQIQKKLIIQVIIVTTIITIIYYTRNRQNVQKYKTRPINLLVSTRV